MNKYLTNLKPITEEELKRCERLSKITMELSTFAKELVKKYPNDIKLKSILTTSENKILTFEILKVSKDGK